MPHTLSGKSRRAELSASTKDQFTKRHRSYLNVLQYNLSTKSILHTLNNFTNFVDTYTDQISIYSAFNEHYIHIAIDKSTYIYIPHKLQLEIGFGLYFFAFILYYSSAVYPL